MVKKKREKCKKWKCFVKPSLMKVGVFVLYFSLFNYAISALCNKTLESSGVLYDLGIIFAFAVMVSISYGLACGTIELYYYAIKKE